MMLRDAHEIQRVPLSNEQGSNDPTFQVTFIKILAIPDVASTRQQLLTMARIVSPEAGLPVLPHRIPIVIRLKHIPLVAMLKAYRVKQGSCRP